MTMYNEKEEEFDKSLRGIYQNLDRFKQAGIRDEEIAVIVLIDGIDKMHHSMSRLFEL